MPEDAPGIHLLLQSMLSSQQTMASDLRDVTKSMATKDDVAAVTQTLKDTISRREYDDYVKVNKEEVVVLGVRIKALEDKQLPRWLWPALTTIISIVSPIITAIITHKLRQ